jgi:hypothetical protein
MAITVMHSKRFLATAAAAAYASSSPFASAFLNTPKAAVTSARSSLHQLPFSTSSIVGSVRSAPASFSLASSYSDGGVDSEAPNFRRYDKIQVEVVRFGKLGASVEVIGLGHKEEDCIGEEEPALGLGLILQREIQYFRYGRGGLDVIVGEVLPAYVERVREDGRLDISLRDPGGKGKADTIGSAIMAKLRETEDGTLDIGDKSTPDEINAVFPGTSKGAFKKAVAALYKKGLVQPGKNTITLLSKD